MWDIITIIIISIETNGSNYLITDKVLKSSARGQSGIGNIKTVLKGAKAVLQGAKAVWERANAVLKGAEAV